MATLSETDRLDRLEWRVSGIERFLRYSAPQQPVGAPAVVDRSALSESILPQETANTSAPPPPAPPPPTPPLPSLQPVSSPIPVAPLRDSKREQLLETLSTISRTNVPATEPFNIAHGESASVTSENENTLASPVADAFTNSSQSTRPSKPVLARSSFEQSLGLKWAGWLGAVVLLVGAGLGVRFIYEQGWFHHVSPIVWLGLIFAVGAALLMVGDFVHRRVNPIPGASLLGAGIATLFLASYAGDGYYNLYDPTVALTLTLMVSIVGAIFARRGNLVSVGILSVVGGSLIPLLLSTAHPHLDAFLTYLMMVQIVALSLSFLGAEPKWWALRIVALLNSTLWLIAVVIHPDFAHVLFQPLLFAIVSGVLFQCELIGSTLRSNSGLSKSHGGSGTTFSLFVTAIVTMQSLFILRHETSHIRLILILSLTVACGLCSILLRRSSLANGKKLAFGFAVQSAGLLVVAAPVALSGNWLTLTWGMLALGFAIISRRDQLPAARFAAVATWLLAVGDLVVTDAIKSLTIHPRFLFFILGTGITSRLLVGWLLSLVGIVIAVLLKTSTAKDTGARASTVSASVLMTITSIGFYTTVSLLALPTAGATAALIALAWLLAGADAIQIKRWALQARLAPVALLLLIGICFKYVLFDIEVTRLSPDWSPANITPFMNPIMLNAGLLAASVIGLFFLRRQSIEQALTRLNHGKSREGLTFSLLALAIVVLASGLSLQIDIFVARRVLSHAGMAWPAGQLECLLLTMLWGICLIAVCFASLHTQPMNRTKTSVTLGILSILLACFYVVGDCILFRLQYKPAQTLVLFNLQALTGAVLLATLAFGASRVKFSSLLTLTCACVLLTIGIVEIDRAFTWQLNALFTRPDRAEQAALSVFGALSAVACVTIGFRRASAPLRQFGLGLLGLTLLKVVLLDLEHVGTGYRVLSFLALGAIMLGTSVLYGKLTPRLLGEQKATTEK